MTVEYNIRNHNNCIACSRDGFLIRGFYYTDESTVIHANMIMDGHTEGWMGLPHGGIGMGAMMELIYGLRNFPSHDNEIFPLSADFRLGGKKVLIGDAVSLSVSETNGGAKGIIYISGERDPYMEAMVRYKNEDTEMKAGHVSWLPKYSGVLEKNITPLPRYKDCFVCGYDRKYPGLNRELYLLHEGKNNIVFSKAGFNSDGTDDVYRFRKDDVLHPVAALSLLDETMGWGGFFVTAQGGVTVKLSAVFFRDIQVGEKLIVFGRGDRKSGKNPKLMFFWCSGALAAVKQDGSFDIVALSSAQYLTVPQLTEQMRMYLHPHELTRGAFDLAEGLVYGSV